MICMTRVAAGAQKELDIAKTEMVKIAKVATTAQREQDIARGKTRLLNKVISGLQQRLDRLEGRGSVGSDPQPLKSGSSDNGWGPGPAPCIAHAPGGASRSRSAPEPHLSAPLLVTARAAVTSVCRPAVAVKSGATSGSVRSTTTAVLHRGHRYAPNAPHQSQSQSQWLGGDTVDSEMRSPEGTWSEITGEARKTWRSSALPRRVVYDGRPLSAAAGAVMRRYTWKEYGVNI